MKVNVFMVLVVIAVAPSMFAIAGMETVQYRSVFIKGMSVSVVALGREGGKHKCALTASFMGRKMYSRNYLTDEVPVNPRDCTTDDNIHQFTQSARIELRKIEHDW
ncbi:hypothetical protein OCT63_19805 [Vibrio sp. RW]|uniref:hypothetical protein n=1 Tax=Vibrio sp. RW TaxID=2998833 RepID=UPI0022CD53DA|nr:hypothetical protein [Vibrio sp. RW]MDA0146475.1 hypothetical protein [Vibrio sp. RW]